MLIKYSDMKDARELNELPLKAVPLFYCLSDTLSFLDKQHIFINAPAIYWKRHSDIYFSDSNEITPENRGSIYHTVLISELFKYSKYIRRFNNVRDFYEYYLLHQHQDITRLDEQELEMHLSISLIFDILCKYIDFKN